MSLLREKRKNVGAHICKIAFKTIPRCGIAALILLCLGFYFLFPACQTFQQIRAEKNTPYELTATTDNSNIDLNTLMQIEGVEKISPVLNLNASLSLEEYKLDCEIKAVYSSFLSLKFAQGTMYPNSSNMPYLILNKAAATFFSKEQETTMVTAEDTVTLNVNGTERKAVICGIFDDNRNSATVYMSYDTASQTFGQGSNTELLLRLKNKSNAEKVVSSLEKQSIYANFDPNITLSWELLQKQCYQTTLLSMVLLVCAPVLIRQTRRIELKASSAEINALLLSGLISNEVKTIYPFRLAMAELYCFLGATMLAVSVDEFSLLGAGIGMLCAYIVKIICALHY